MWRNRIRGWLVALCLAASVTDVARADESGSVIVTFDAKAIGHIGATGLADPFSGRALTVDDPVRVASLSKLVVALGVMRLVDARRLDLDRDVSDYLGWRVRHPRFPDSLITLRTLLSHRSSLTDNIDYAIPLGGSIRAALADPAAWDGSHAPDSYFRYANLNFPVIASVMEAATGERFDRLMAQQVFMPLGLDACFNWTSCSDAQIARAVVLTDGHGTVRRDRLEGVRPRCPVLPAADGNCDLSAYRPGTNGALFSPQGGLRISARDLAHIGQMLIRRGRGFLSPRSYRALVSPLWRYDGNNGDSEGGFWCRYGLAVQHLATRAAGCRDDPFGDGVGRWGHSGEAYGLRSGLWIDPARRRGVAYFLTAIADDAAAGRSAFTAAEEQLLKTPSAVHK